MAKRPLPTAEQLRQLLRYEPETGKLYWRERGVEWFSKKGKQAPEHSQRCRNGRFANQEALAAPHNKGYLHGNILSAKELTHRVIWALVTGEWPENDIDHENGIKTDNR